MLVGCVVDNQINHDPDAPAGGLLEEFREIAERAEPRVDAVIVGDVIAVVAAW
jgi:hypothetical protein